MFIRDTFSKLYRGKLLIPEIVDKLINFWKNLRWVTKGKYYTIMWVDREQLISHQWDNNDDDSVLLT